MPVTNYDNHLVWIVEVTGAIRCSECPLSDHKSATYEVIDGLTEALLFGFYAPMR